MSSLNDNNAFFNAAIGRTYAILGASTSGAQTPDADQALPPGRYLVQARNFSDNTAIAWLHTGAFVEGGTLPLAAEAGPARIPLSSTALVAIEYNAVPSKSDRIGVITTGGTCDVYITAVSRVADPLA